MSSIDLSSSFILCPICGYIGHGVQQPFSTPGSTAARVDLNKIYSVHRFPMTSPFGSFLPHSIPFPILDFHRRCDVASYFSWPSCSLQVQRILPLDLWVCHSVTSYTNGWWNYLFCWESDKNIRNINTRREFFNILLS